ncbi:hypothetical protein BKA66DRAFT_575606 [Pyrenochaeta sp. MPI-SDFR-AT-0127]|nr:hypothetical protein BKA66DRAFT_575606 [Pyrenochaeta sp. MPI-SDFR-AT-0127]
MNPLDQQYKKWEEEAWQYISDNFTPSINGGGFAPVPQQQQFHHVNAADVSLLSPGQHFPYTTATTSQGNRTQYRCFQNQPVGHTQFPLFNSHHQPGQEQPASVVSHQPHASLTSNPLQSYYFNIPTTMNVPARNPYMQNGMVNTQNALGQTGPLSVASFPRAQAQLNNWQQRETTHDNNQMSPTGFKTSSMNGQSPRAALPVASGQQQQYSSVIATSDMGHRNGMSRSSPAIPSTHARTQAQSPLVSLTPGGEGHSSLVTRPSSLPTSRTPPEFNTSSRKGVTEHHSTAPHIPTMSTQQYMDSSRTPTTALGNRNTMATSVQRQKMNVSQNAQVTAQSLKSYSSLDGRQQSSLTRMPGQSSNNGSKVASKTQRSPSSNGYKNQGGASSPLTSPPGNWQETTSAKVLNVNMSNKSLTCSGTQRSPVRNGNMPRTTAKSPLAAASKGTLLQNLVPSKPFPNTARPNNVAPERLELSNSQQSCNSKSSFPATAPNGRPKSTTPSTSGSIANTTSHMPTRDQQSCLTPSRITHGQKRPADDTQKSDAQGQKRQATPGSNVQRGSTHYQTPSIIQRLSASKAAQVEEMHMVNPQISALQEQQARHTGFVEQQRLNEAERFERERRLRRKRELIKDPSALYRHYTEFLEHYPIPEGQLKSRYHANLLANQRMPIDKECDLGLAITYAKDHWDIYLEYPRDVTRAANLMKAQLEKVKEDLPKAESEEVSKKRGRSRR